MEMLGKIWKFVKIILKIAFWALVIFAVYINLGSPFFWFSVAAGLFAGGFGYFMR